MRKIDIDKRTYNFALRIIKFVNRLPKNMVAYELGKQLLKSGTSVAANVEEAQGAFSKDDFVYKIGIALKEAKETYLWLKLIKDSGIDTSDELNGLIEECFEIKKILGKIFQKSKYP